MATRDLLPTHVKPRHYALTLTPDLNAFTFEGHEEVRLDVISATNTLVFHAKEITVRAVSVRLPSGAVERASSVSLDTAKDRVTVVLPSALEASHQVTLVVDFDGSLNDKMAGFYRSGYVLNGERRHMAVTQFEATDARRAFPCWDEPLLKATFDVTLVVPSDRTALSNMPVLEERDLGNGKKRVTYDTTPIMSTYLLAFAVGDFDHVETRTREGVVVRVYTPVGQRDEGLFALDVAARTLSYFTEYFAIAYPISKIDLVAVPDFAAGAMENWGLVTFRTALLLYNEKTTPIEIKQRIAYIVGHELAHQWFGNLCTMEWWTHLWLNEGFATWVGWLAVDRLFPEWRVWEQFIVNEFQRGMTLDSLLSSHPVEVEIPSSTQVDEIFDAISYAKGAAVIRMLVAYLEEDVFRRGIELYIQRHKYANAATGDLWAALSDISGRDVRALMQAWTLQTGYPVVTVSIDAAGNLKASQARYLGSGAQDAARDESLWIVPLQLSSDAFSGVRDEVLSGRSGTFSVGKAGWVKVNTGQTGFYRVRYEGDMLARLAAVLPTLPASDRVGLVNDAFSLACAGYAPTTGALTLLSHLGAESEYVVWADVASNLKALLAVWHRQPDDVVQRLRAFCRGVFSPIAESLGWDVPATESHLRKLLRPIALSYAGRLGHPGVLAEGRARFERFAKGDASALHADVRAPAIAMVLAHGGRAEFETAVGLYKAAESQDLRITILSALGASGNPALVGEALSFAFGEHVRDQDSFHVVASAASNAFGRRVTWHYIRDNWTAIHARYPHGAMLLGRIVSVGAEFLSTAEEADDVERFFREKNVTSIARSVDQTVEKIRSNAKWVERDAAVVAAWLRDNVQV